jgi:EAL and modified HD-GYP domain-containing signal transduction protein
MREGVEKVFVGRQPIYRDGVDVFGYELLSRDSELNRAAFTDGDKATAQLLLNTFLDIGLDQIVGSHLAFVNVTRNFLFSEYCESLPKGRVVLEVGDTVVDPALLERLSHLASSGYCIALDHFTYDEQLRPLVELSDIVKLNIQALDRDTIAQQVSALRAYEVKLLAQKVETHEDYQYCKELGFDYYQGYFFCKPQIVSETKIPSNRLSTLHLLAKLQDPRINIPELEHAVGQDLAVSYRILRYLNSPMLAMPRKIESLRHAISLVGTRLICNWASLILVEAIEDKPRELMVTTMVRAHMCQQLGAAMRQGNLDQFFTVGLFSLIDALVDRPMAEALKVLPLIDDVKNALLHRKGLMGKVLDCVEAYERCDWEHTTCETLDEKNIREAFLSSVAYARKITGELVS